MDEQKKTIAEEIAEYERELEDVCKGKKQVEELRNEAKPEEYADACELISEYEDRIDTIKREIERLKYLDTVDQVSRQKWDFNLQALEPVSALLAEEIPESRIYVGDIRTPLLAEGVTVLAAAPKMGKSWFCLNLCLAVSTGSEFLGFPTREAHVMYCDLEQSDGIRQKRIRQTIEKIGVDVPGGFYVRDMLQSIGHGFKEQIECDLKSDPEIGVYIVDIFANIESARKNTETEYQWTYRNFTVINELAKRFHVAFVLVLHTRKGQDPDRPFENILGSTANAGAASHLIVLAKDKFNSESVHLYAQGRETEGVIELDYKNDGGKLIRCEAEQEAVSDREEFESSEIRDCIVRFMEKTTYYKGKCQMLINECALQGIGLDASPKELGRFLVKHSGRFMKYDGILVEAKSDGNAGKTYTISKQNNEEKSTIGTIATIGNWQTCNGEIPFETA